MTNPANNAGTIGRLASDPKVFENEDGSKKILFTVYADRNYTDRNGKRGSDALPFEAFVPAKVSGIGPYANVHKGDLVAVSSALRMDNYTDEVTGRKVFKLKIISEDIKFLESKATTTQRLSNRLAEAQAQVAAQNQAQVPAAAPAAAEVPAAAAVPQFPMAAPAAAPAVAEAPAAEAPAAAPVAVPQFAAAQSATPASDQAQFAAAIQQYEQQYPPFNN